MHLSTVLLSAMAVSSVVGANVPPTYGDNRKYTPTTTKKVEPTTLTTIVKALPTDKTNNGNIIINKCVNIGLTVATCTQLLNIVALNDADINIGQGLLRSGQDAARAKTTPAAEKTNNGNIFINRCLNVGVSILDCSQVLNLVLLNGISINIL